MPEGNLVKVGTPKFISLVGKPANQTTMRIVRSAPASQKGPSMTTRRLRRSTGEVNPVLQLTFPEAMTDAEVTAALVGYGMADYKVERKDGKVTAIRSDLQSIARSDATVEIKLTKDVTAIVQRTDAMLAAVVNGQPGIVVSSFTFSGEKFADSAAVQEWIERNSVDKAGEPTQNSDQCFVVTRSAVEDGAETRQIEVEEGVVANIVRADAQDIPASMVEVISEAAYGGYGWGQLDFFAAMADEEFCEWMDDGLYRLKQVLNNILFYSQLPLDVRKQLVSNALSQFDAFVAAVMDSMPRQLMISVVRSAQPKEKLMSTQTQGQGGTTATTAVRSDANTAPTVAAPAADEKVTVTRSELATLIRDGIAAAEKERADAAAAQAQAEAEKAERITRSDATKLVEEATKPLLDKIAALEGTTVVRSAGSDPAVTQAEPEKKDVFRGAFGTLPIGRKKAQA